MPQATDSHDLLSIEMSKSEGDILSLEGHDYESTDNDDQSRALLSHSRPNNEVALDLESQGNSSSPLSLQQEVGAEYAVPIKSKIMHLALYFTLNVSLTIYNKSLLVKVPNVIADCLICPG